jgi:dimethylaniline monooxygenase (N-oxide forming)
MVSPKQVCVIGAGVSGLAAAKAFAEHGHKVTIIEKSGNLGGVWDPARCYPDVQTQSPKDLYRYTDQAMPDTYPEWPKGPQVHALSPTMRAAMGSIARCASRPVWSR